MAFPRPRICRTRLTTLMLLLVTGALLLTLFNYALSSEKTDPASTNDILDPRYLSRQNAYKKKLIEKFNLEDGKGGPSQMCKVPSLSLKTDVNQFAFRDMPALECETKDLFVLENQEIRINQKVLRKRNITKCVYKSIEWETDTSFQFSDPVEKKYPGPYEMKIKNEFFHVECYLDGKDEEEQGGKSNEGKSYQMYEMQGGSPVGRRLMQNKNKGDRVEIQVKNPASDEEINKMVEKQNMKGIRLGDVVRKIQNEVQPQEKSGHIERKDDRVGSAKGKLPKSEQVHGREGGWMDGPRYMGSMGLPDSPLINKRAQYIHQQQQAQQQQEQQQKDRGLVAGNVLNSNFKSNDLNQQNGHLQKPKKDVVVSDTVPNRYERVQSELGEEKKIKAPKKHVKNQPDENQNRQVQDDTVKDVKSGETKLEKSQEKKLPKGSMDNQLNSKEKKTETEEDNVVKKDGSKEVEEDPNYRGTDMMFDQSREFNYNYPNFDSPDFEQFFAQIIPKLDLVKKAREMEVPKDRPSKMNVLIFGMDSMSHLTYQRKMPKTYRHIQEEMGAVVLNGYNIVGDATTAAIIPLTTGHTEMELPEVRKSKPGSTYVDSYPLIWNKFEQQGYVTLFSEDKPDIATFNLRLNGFEEIPVDHYMRPFYQAVLASNLKENSASYCTGGKPSHLYMLNYVKELFQRYPKDVPKFAFSFISDLSHDDNDPAQFADEDVLELFKWMEREGHLENTVVVVMADHGARYSRIRQTTQGKLEERLPMMSFVFPKWFQKEYPKAMANLRVNSDRLTTPFDVHETLKSIMDPRTLKKPLTGKERGISLLRPHPLSRTCESAGIDMHWCTCMNWQEVDPHNDRVLTAGGKLVEYINSMVNEHPDICSPLKLSRILDAKLGLPNEKVLKYLKSADGDQRVANFTNDLKSDVFYMQLILETLPGRGQFEATVIISDGGDDYKVSPDISRINLYGDQAHCVVADLPDLRKYCYCNKPKPTTKPRLAHGQKHNSALRAPHRKSR